MPYKRVGKVIYHKKDGGWKVKQRCGSVTAAEAAMQLLQGLEHGSIKPENVGKKK